MTGVPGSATEVDLTRVAVLGAGVMGVGITEVLLDAGVTVQIHDPKPSARASFPDRLERARRAHDLPLLHEGDWSVHDRLDDAVADVDLAIEAGPEDVALKQRIFADLDSLLGPDVVLATNSSSMPVGLVGTRVGDRRRLVGMHFWNPPALVPLVEVMPCSETAATTASRAMAALAAWGLTPVLVQADVPGMIGNRLQHALKREAIALVAAGVCSAETVDLVVRTSFGARLGSVGPLEQSDLSGTDLTLSIHEVLMPDLDVTQVAHPFLVDMVARGDLGASTGRGFREWTPREAERRRAEISHDLLEQARRRREDADGHP